MKNCKKIVAEGLVLAGLLGLFGCNTNVNRTVALEYRTKSAVVYDQTSKIEEYLKTQGYTMVQKNYSHFTNTGDICYTKDKTQISIKMGLGESDNIDMDILINTRGKNLEFSSLEKELYKIMGEKTK